MYTVDGVMIDVGVQSEKASSGLDKLASALNRIKVAAGGNLGLENVKTQINGINAANKRFAGFAKTLVSLAAVTKVLSAGITKSNEYVENLNLFRVALGRYADDAERYAKTVERVMGIDSSEWMRNQGTFMQIATGFGMAEDRAYKLSKALTQVSYDIASFYNISTEQAMLKVRSGIAGELEPLRNLGYALDTATLQQIAYANGINMKVTAMTQAQKAELRYVAIMSQSKNAINDMSRTYSTSANQLRVLAAHVNVLARSFGNILIPAINAVLPVVIMFVNVISNALNMIAKLFGFAMPSVDWGSSGLSDASDAAGNLGDNLGSATGSAKKLQRVLMGFDELNVMPDAGGGGGGGGGGAVGGFGGSLGIDFDDYMYDFLDGMYKKAKEVDWAMAGIAAAVAGLAIPAATLLGWKNLSNIVGGLVTIAATLRVNFELAGKYLDTGDRKYLIGELGITTLAGGILTTIFRNAGFTKDGKSWKYGFASALVLDAGVTLAAVYKGVAEGSVSVKDRETIVSDIKAVVQTAIGGLMVAGPKGALIGLVIGAAATVAVNLIAVNKNAGEMDWGEVEATREQLRAYALEKLGNIDVDATINLLTDQIQGLDIAKENLDSAVLALRLSTNTIRLGIDTSPEAAEQIKSDALAVVESGKALLTEQQKSLELAVTILDPVNAEGKSMSDALLSASGNAIGSLQAGYEDLGARLTEYISEGMSDGISTLEAQQIANLSTALSRISSAVTMGEISGAFMADLQFSIADLDKDSLKGLSEEFEGIKSELTDTLTAYANQQYIDMQGQLAGLKELQASYRAIGDMDAANALSEQIKELEAAINDYDISTTAEAKRMEILRGAKDEMLAGLNEWLDIGKNLDKMNVLIDNYLSGFIESAINEGDYSQLADGVIKSIEFAFGDQGLNLAALGLTGRDFLTDELKSVLDSAFSYYNVPPEIAEQIWSSLTGVSDGIITGIQNSKTGAMQALSDVIAAIKREANKSAIKMKVGLTSDGSSLKVTGAGGTGLDIKTIQLRASGGIPDYGSMFIAGEAGPELVGRIGNKTGVVNSGQISEIIAAEMARNGGSSPGNEEAVARAVAGALSNMELKVDGDDFGRIVVKSINARRQKTGKVEILL